MPNGRALTGQSHDYKRHGTTTQFAALNVATGKVSGRQYKRRRRIEFLDFMNRIVAEHPGRELHVILDNLNTHKPKNDRWLKRHPNVHFHFTPTKASWLNQVEIWFSILAAKALAGGSFNSRKELMAHITQQQVAAELGTVREVISRLLNEFQRRGWLTLVRGGMTITDRRAMTQLAAEG
jgi:transposase